MSITIVERVFSDLSKSKKDRLTERPERYSSRELYGHDVIDLIKAWNLNFNEGNILKYLLRDKGEDVEDMLKIEDYAKRERQYLENQILKKQNDTI